MDQPNSEPLTGNPLAQDLFRDMNSQVDGIGMNGHAEEGEPEQKVVEEIESLCMNCQEMGTTRLLLTKIPFFREIIIMSFRCPECGFQNSEIQSAGVIQQRGAKYTYKVGSEVDLQRQVVKTDTCVFRIEDIDLEIPQGRGQFTNIEGIVRSVMEDLQSQQEERMRQMPEVGEQVARVIRSLNDMLDGRKYPFTVSADDPSGNSWIEPKPGDPQGRHVRTEYDRTSGQNAALGLGDDVPMRGNNHSHAQAPETAIRPEYHASNLTGGTTPPVSGTQLPNNVDNEDIVENEVYEFPATCPGCTRPCNTNMKMVNIPYFKQVVLMSTVCQQCGYRSNEVKTGGEVPEKGRKITLKVESSADLSRDVLKGESAAFSCPELRLDVEPGTLGGRFTTVEGLLTQIRRDLRAQAFGLEDGDAPLENHDAVEPEAIQTWDQFFSTLTDAIEGRKKFTMVLQDPLAGSYVQSFTAPEPDPQISVEEYERTAEEEEHLGLKYIKTEEYEAVEQAPAA